MGQLGESGRIFPGHPAYIVLILYNFMVMEIQTCDQRA